MLGLFYGRVTQMMDKRCGGVHRPALIAGIHRLGRQRADELTRDKRRAEDYAKEEEGFPPLNAASPS
jgi:hypothetical protein